MMETYERTTGLKRAGSQFFTVDPKTIDDTRSSPTGAGIAGYQYKFPTLQRIAPIRQLVIYPRQRVSSAASPIDFLVTLRDMQGNYIVKDMPASRFAPDLLTGGRNVAPLYFGPGIVPDPRQCYLLWPGAGEVDPASMEFVYA
jgi:hypothetical protein